MGQLRQLFSHTLVYGASSIVGRVLNYLLVPLYTTVFAPGDYGVVTELYAYVAFFNILYTYGLETAYFRFATDGDAAGSFRRAQGSLMISSVFFSGMVWWGADHLANLLDYPGQGMYLRWLALILAFDAMVIVPFARLRLEKRPIRFASLKLTGIAANIAFNLFFLLVCPWWITQFPNGLLSRWYDPELGVGYVFLSNVLSNALYLVFFIHQLWPSQWRPDADWWKMMRYGAPLMVLGLAGVTNEMLSRALLKHWLPEGFYPDQTNMEALGIFGACYKISVFMTLAVQAFRYAFEPFFFSKSKEKGSPVLFATVMHAFIVFACFAWLVLSLFLYDYAPLFLRKQAYLTGLDIVPWLLGGGVLMGVYFNLSVWYKLTDRTSYGAWITMAGAVITVALNLTLIPILGYMGSAVTTLISYLTMVVASYLLGQKHYFIPYHTGKGLFYFIFTGLSIASVYFWDFDQIVKYFVATGLVVLYLLLVWKLDWQRGTFTKTS